MSNFADERDLPGDLHGFEEVLEAFRFDTLSPENMTIYELNAHRPPAAEYNFKAAASGEYRRCCCLAN